MRDCPYIAARGRESKKVSINVLKDDVQATRHFFALQTRGEKPGYDDDDILSPCFPLRDTSSFSVAGMVRRWDRII